MTKILKPLSLILAALMLFSSCTVLNGVQESNISASASADTAAKWLEDRLGDTDSSKITLGTADDAESYGVDLSDLRDDGYIIRKSSGNTLILGKTADGLDRGVRRYANYYTETDTVNYTYGEGLRVKSISIAGTDISEFVILLREDADECHTFAADELRKYIGAACGYYPDIVNTAGEHNFVLKRVMPDDERYEELGDEGFTLSVKGNDFYISGGYLRGCLYGVYDFLEECVGWRFITDYETGNCSSVESSAGYYLYESDGISIPADYTHTETPSFLYRGCMAQGSFYNNNYSVKNKTNGLIMGKTKYNGFGYISTAGHGSHSHLFTDYDGWKDCFSPQPCFSDEDHIQIAIDYYTDMVNSQLEAGKQIGYDITCISVGQEDTPYFCHCEDCMEIVYTDMCHTGPILQFTNAIADAIYEEFGGGIWVGMLSYWGTTMVPKVTRPHKNVNISYCFWLDVDKMFCSNHPIDGSQCAPFQRNTDRIINGIQGSFKDDVTNYLQGQDIREWCEVAERVTVWYYPGSWNVGCVMTSSTIKNLRADLAFLEDIGVYGIYVCKEYTRYSQDFLMSYLLERLLWDSQITEDEYWDMIREYLYIVYGDGCDSLIKYLEYQIEYAKDGCWSVFSAENRIDIDKTRDTFEYVISLFDDAERLACSAKQEELVRLFSRNAYYTGLVASHSGWYLHGTPEQKARYIEIFDYFKELAVSTSFYLMIYRKTTAEDFETYDMNINPLYLMKDEETNESKIDFFSKDWYDGFDYDSYMETLTAK